MRTSVVLLLGCVFTLASCVWFCALRGRGELRSHRGTTMGSTFAVTWVESEAHPTIAQEVDELLAQITRLMSTYESDSQLSAFNRSTSTEWFEVAPSLAEVVTIAQSVSELSNGVFDITVKPLVAAWGFGPSGSPVPPTEAEFSNLAKLIGFQRLSVRLNPPALRKQAPEVQVDLNAIAPGYAVDQIAKLLVARGINDYLIDVGGELRASGRKSKNSQWQVAIELPDGKGQLFDASFDLEDMALATSGDYRNYIERDGKRLSHTLDPRTMRPIEHRLASVTVLAPTAAQADAWATALNVWGPDEGLRRAARNDWSVLMLVRTDDGGFEQRKNGHFATQP
jgi:FAD:protein FMN transferase